MQNWKFDNARMRELVSHMIMVYELPFNFVEYDLFNLLMKEANPTFKILSKMVVDILAIPLTIVASESAFSVGGRVIDPHRSSLGTNMVDKLICGADWYRHYYGLQKKKTKEQVDF
ncbi:zinc finger BED domain-containing protein RICESLEEPER 2-like protein, partial [Tanacetum coccineum]